jgi:hypothetical protein
VLRGIFDLPVQSYSTVGTSRLARMGGYAEGVSPRRGLAWARRARRCEKMPLGAVHLCPQQEAGEICGLVLQEEPPYSDAGGSHDQGKGDPSHR